MSENHREPEVPETEVPAVERLDGHAQKNLHQNILWKEVPSRMLVLQEQERWSVWEKSAPSHIVRLMNSRQKNPKGMMTEVQWLCWRRVIDKKEKLLSTNVTIDQGNLGRRVIRSCDKIHLNVKSSHARQLDYVFQDMTSPKSILRKCTDMPKPIQRVKFTKTIARHTKIRDQNPSLGYICPGEPD